MKKRLILIGGLIFVTIIAFSLLNKPSTGQSVQQIEVVPLSSEEKQIVQNVLASTGFIKDIPEKNPISIRFFSFENGQRVWHDGFLLGGENPPTIQLILHSKYISELNSNNLCEIIQRANKNGDLGFYSESNKASLLIKYAGMMKHRKCFGF